MPQALTSGTPTGEPPTTEPGYFSRGYRRTLLWTDAIAFAVTSIGIVGAVSSDASNVRELFLFTAYAGAAALALGGPVVHAAHGNFGRSLGSFGLRMGSATVLAGAGLALANATMNCSGDRPFCEMNWNAGGFAVGAFAGLLTGALLDMAIQGNPEPPPESEVALTNTASWHLSPYADPKHGNYGVLLGRSL